MFRAAIPVGPNAEHFTIELFLTCFFLVLFCKDRKNDSFLAGGNVAFWLVQILSIVIQQKKSTRLLATECNLSAMLAHNFELLWCKRKVLRSHTTERTCNVWSFEGNEIAPENWFSWAVSEICEFKSRLKNPFMLSVPKGKVAHDIPDPEGNLSDTTFQLPSKDFWHKISMPHCRKEIQIFLILDACARWILFNQYQRQN